MRSLSQKIIFILLLSLSAFAQSPHGDDFDFDCELCHKSDDWKVDLKKVQFDHSTTKFELIGQHKSADCRSCHVTLEFSKVKPDCISCHTDLHQGTVGKDCSKCHTSKTWMVEDINGLHQKGRFPLLGNHMAADCQSCHTRYLDLYFEPLNNDCYTCHSDNYNSTQNPNHASAGFSTECQDCHEITATEWTASSFDHNLTAFPLTGSHLNAECSSCHEASYSGTPTDCFACHEDDFNSALDPNHIQSNFPNTCAVCHNTTAWEPASFDHALTAFPLNGKTYHCRLSGMSFNRIYRYAN